MADLSKPSIIGRGVEQAIRALCELWGYEVDELTALPDADNLVPVAGEIDASDEDTPRDPDPNAATRRMPLDDLEPAEELPDDEDDHGLVIASMAQERNIEEQIHREALRHLLELAEDLHEQARQPGARPPTRPM